MRSAVSPPEGSSSSCARRSGLTSHRVGPSSSATGAESARRACAAARASVGPVRGAPSCGAAAAPVRSAGRARRAVRRSSAPRRCGPAGRRSAPAERRRRARGDDRGVDRQAIYLFRDPVQLVLERAREHGRGRRDVCAEEVDVEALEAPKRPEAVPLPLRGVDRRLPVGLHAELVRPHREPVTGGDEDDRPAGERAGPPLEQRACRPWPRARPRRCRRSGHRRRSSSASPRRRARARPRRQRQRRREGGSRGAPTDPSQGVTRRESLAGHVTVAEYLEVG